MKTGTASFDSNGFGGPPEAGGSAGVRGDRDDSRTTVEWLQSAYLGRVAARAAHSYGLGTEDVPDLLQELRIALWQAGPETRVGPTWLFQVALHKSVDLLRNRARMRQREQVFARASERPGRDAELDYLLHARAARLPARLRQFYDLHYSEGLSEREIADRLGLCRASVRWLDRSCRRSVAGQSGPRPSRRTPGLLE